jgi:hypothetical protein
MANEQRSPSDSQSLKRLEALERQSEESSDNSLSLELTPSSLVSAVRKACKHEDREIASIHVSVGELSQRGQIPPIACRKGCWHCCAQIVGATIPEILRIAQLIRTHWTTEEQAALGNRIEEFIAASTPFLSGKSDVKPRHACPLLQDSACSVWDARPFICRGANSTDVNLCIRKREDPSSEINVPQIPAQYFASIYARTGFRRSLKRFGLDAGLYDLASGLKIALANDDAEDRYLAGENLFKSVELPSRSIG